jgi:glutamine synthetase
MLELDFEKMLFNIPANRHMAEEIKSALTKHPEVKFVSLVGIDIGGLDTDEKIPVKLFMEDIEKFLEQGVQTDGSSVVLPVIADLNNAKVDIIPDIEVNWYVDYNFANKEITTGLPVGTLRIPSSLVHNDDREVGSRYVLKQAIKNVKFELKELIKQNPYVIEYLDINNVEDIEEIILTCATELEFWVKTPDDKADREQLSTAQILKEQYWKRTIGPVRTALEKSLILLDEYGFEVEMGHKEVGGIKAKLGNSGQYDHVMEQLEVDWKYANAMQAADNEKHARNVIRDIFRLHGLDVSFMAKPIEGVAGNGEHTHMGIAAKLKDGKIINLFAAKDMEKDFMNPIGFGALMGILKNYEVVNPFISSSNDSINRLKPGYEAPICIVTSIGHSVKSPSRNRTVLVGLVRDAKNPLAVRFEMRSPNPKSNTYLTMATCYMAMMDGIKAALEAKKTTQELLESLSKPYGQEDFYLEKNREYRSEKDVFDQFTPEERDKLFGQPPNTVWENINAFEKYPDKLNILLKNGAMDDLTLESYKEATMGQWTTELHNRIIPETMDLVRACKRLHDEDECTDYDMMNWGKIHNLRIYLGQNSIAEKCLLARIITALEEKNYDLASNLQIEMQEKSLNLSKLYFNYKKNLL